MTVCAFLNAIPSFVIEFLLMLVFQSSLAGYQFSQPQMNWASITDFYHGPDHVYTLIPHLRTAIIDELQSPAVEGARGTWHTGRSHSFKDVLYNTPSLFVDIGEFVTGVLFREVLLS